jgi:glycerol-3-phosphate acyltransferase PlsY
VSEALAVVLAYLLGSIPFALLAGWLRGVDLRDVGSGNPGAANVFRSLGRGLGLAVMVADIGKGVLAVLLARWLTDSYWPVIAAGAVIAGHVFPVWLRFRGGKGVAVGCGAVIGLMPLASAALIALWVLIVAVTRYTSLASVTCAVAFTPLVWALGYPWPNIVFAAVASALVLARHRANVGRLIRGQELRIELRRPSRA